jgi:hypothetical protein
VAFGGRAKSLWPFTLLDFQVTGFWQKRLQSSAGFRSADTNSAPTTRRTATEEPRNYWLRPHTLQVRARAPSHHQSPLHRHNRVWIFRNQHLVLQSLPRGVRQAEKVIRLCILPQVHEKEKNLFATLADLHCQNTSWISSIFWQRCGSSKSNWQGLNVVWWVWTPNWFCICLSNRCEWAEIILLKSLPAC